MFNRNSSLFANYYCETGPAELDINVFMFDFNTWKHTLVCTLGPYQPEQEHLNEPQMHHFFVSFWQRWWKNSYQRRVHDGVIQLSSSWSCSGDSVGGLNRSDLSPLHVRCFPLQWGGLKVSHSTAHPARGGPRHLRTGRLHRQAPDPEHLLEHREKEMDLYNWCSWFYFSVSH